MQRNNPNIKFNLDKFCEAAGKAKQNKQPEQKSKKPKDFVFSKLFSKKPQDTSQPTKNTNTESDPTDAKQTAVRLI